jgi:hypothetical protein
VGELKDIITAVAATTTKIDPHDVAVEVVAQIPRNKYRAILLELVPAAVREHYRAQRHVTEKRGVRTGSNVSKRWERNSAGSDPFLWREYVPRCKEWKVLGDCDRDDCVSIATSYFADASASQQLGMRFQALAEEVGTGKVSDLGLDKFTKIWEGK